jgi:exodeoxyribonuclease-1
MFKAVQGSFSLVWPMGDQPGRPNEIILWDLRSPFEPFLDLDPAELRQRIFQTSEELDRQGLARLPAKTLHTNRCPVVVRDLRLLTPAVAERYQVDLAEAQARGARLAAQPGFRDRVREAFAATFPGGCQDPDYSIYGGGFFSSQDRDWMNRIGRTPASRLASLHPDFQDPRLDELFFRYRARNWPESLDGPEQARWAAHCEARLNHPPVHGQLSRADFHTLLAECRAQHPDRAALWQELADYAGQGPVS